MKKSTVLKLLGCSLLTLLATDLQAQLIKQIKFSKAEGYTDGPLFGQPAGGGASVWTSVSDNQGNSFVTNDVPWIVLTVTNGAMHIWPDQNFGTNTSGTIYFTLPFPAVRKGPLTATWDWQFFPTNEIPADYDPTNNNYNASLQGTDHGFTFADSLNRMLDDNPFAVFNELCTPNRMGGVCDARWNTDYSMCDGGGNWNNVGPEFKDGKLLHMKLVAYFGDAASPTNNSFDVWAQRDGEEVWHTTVNDTFPDGAFPMRRCPTANGIDCLTLWLNGGTFSTHITVSNIRIVGPNPVVEAPTVSLERTTTGIKVTYTGTLQSADTVQGPYTNVTGKSPLEIPASGQAKFYRTKN